MAYADRQQAGHFGRELLGDVVEAARARAGAQSWLSRAEGMWHSLAPPTSRVRVQGWKRHVSATPLSAPLVLAQAAPVLLEHGCTFKFAATLDRVVELTSGRCERSQGGKFLTAYPCDDERFKVLAEALDQVTGGLPGPPVLSDRPYRPGSLVSYCFGAFSGAAGVLGVLVRPAAMSGGVVTAGHVQTVADWIVERLPTAPRTLPGLFSGRSGTAWALHSAARLFGDVTMERRAVSAGPTRTSVMGWPCRVSL